MARTIFVLSLDHLNEWGMRLSREIQALQVVDYAPYADALNLIRVAIVAITSVITENQKILDRPA